MKNELLERAELAMERHKEFIEEWKEGGVSEAWIDENNNLCVRYESGRWFHYKDLDLPFPTWW